MAQDKVSNPFQAPRNGATRLRELLRRDNHITVCPGVYDGLTARIALRDGFDCLYMVRLQQKILLSHLQSVISALY